MLKVLICTIALSAPVASFAGTVNGLYRTEANDEGSYLVVKFAPCASNASQSCGTIIKAVDKNGKSASDYEHLGKKIVWAMKDKGNGKYSGGKIWAPDTDKTYASKMTVQSGSLKVSGCVAIICRSQLWKAAK